MSTIQIAYPILLDNRLTYATVKASLAMPKRKLAYLLEWSPEGGAHPGAVDAVILEADMARWQWLDLLLRIRRTHAEVPVIVFAVAFELSAQLLRLPSDPNVFLVSDVNALQRQFRAVIALADAARRRVLFVDDDPHILKGYARALRHTPWQLLTAESGEKALEVLAAGRVDLVITDIKMPQLHGIDLVARIRERERTLPILVCSAFPGMREDSSLRYHGITGFIEKPADAETLERAIRGALPAAA
jgi:DNA-binding NtrC family response regulator